MALREIIQIINEPFEKIIKGIKVYGIAESILRQVGSETEVIPGIISNDGEIQYVGVDDLESVIIYHKASAIGTRLSPRKGVGDEPNQFINAYAMAMIVYIDRKKTNLTPEEFFLFIQANLPYQIDLKPFTNVLTQINTVILNSQTVFDSEYKGSKKMLPSNHSLMQINYTIESTFKQQCFEKCPEDC